jgi:ABC-type phosphate transport system substrate-binding protein
MKHSIFALALLLLSVSALAQAPSHSAGYRIVLHPQSSVSTLDDGFVADAFLKKVVRWPNGEAIRPVDLPSNSSIRQRFVEGVLGRSLSAVRSYWQQQIFSGRNIPPPELDSDAAVIAYVNKYRGAIGYVSADANVEGVKVVTVK